MVSEAAFKQLDARLHEHRRALRNYADSLAEERDTVVRNEILVIAKKELTEAKAHLAELKKAITFDPTAVHEEDEKPIDSSTAAIFAATILMHSTVVDQISRDIDWAMRHSILLVPTRVQPSSSSAASLVSKNAKAKKSSVSPLAEDDISVVLHSTEITTRSKHAQQLTEEEKKKKRDSGCSSQFRQLGKHIFESVFGSADMEAAVELDSSPRK